MGDKSAIQWTDATWNPTTGCDRVSPGCANCYALTLAARLKAMGVAGYQNDGDPATSGPGFALTLHEDRLELPLRWKRPRRIFVDSMSDLFHPAVPVAFLDRVFAAMVLAPQHTFQVLTKRPERMREYMTTPRSRPYREQRIHTAAYAVAESVPFGPARGKLLAHLGDYQWPLPNVWLGTSVENRRWKTRIDDLRATPAAVRFLSCEPLLGPLVGPLVREFDALDQGMGPLDLTGIDWVIIGGESGPGARPMDVNWVRDIIRACRAQGAAPFVKQMGDVWSRTVLGHPGHGGDIATFSNDVRVREYPT